MKNVFFLLTCLCFIFAGKSHADSIDRALKQSLIGLAHKNHGVVEATIINVMKIKMVHPERDYDKIIRKLKKLKKCGDTDRICLKANLAAKFLEHPERFTWLKCESYPERKKVFEELVASLE